MPVATEAWTQLGAEPAKKEAEMYFDADAHIDECEETWADVDKDLRPTTITFAPGEIPTWLEPREGASARNTRMWFLDGRVYIRRIRSDEFTGTTVATRELQDVPARLEHMDRLGIGVQVIYPTLFITEPFDRPEVERELYQSYNSWLAQRCAASGGRLRFVAMVPMGSVPEGIEEMRRAKELGACGVFKRGIEWGRGISDPYFFPLYEEAQALDLPVCIHSSLPLTPIDPRIARMRPIYTLGFTHVTVLQAFYSLIADQIPDRFSQLRFGFIEAGSSWLPHLCDILKVTDRHSFLERSRLYVTCEVGEDLSYIVDNFGCSNLIVGTDYTHGDRSAVIDAHETVAKHPGLAPEAATAITSTNATRFYGI